MLLDSAVSRTAQPQFRLKTCADSTILGLEKGYLWTRLNAEVRSLWTGNARSHFARSLIQGLGIARGTFSGSEKGET